MNFEETTVTRRFKFCYAHHLPSYTGKCREVHGHNAVVEVTFGGTADDYPGMVIDFSKIKEHVKPIIEKLDHKNLNDLPLLCSDGLPPTAEVIAEYIGREIRLTAIGKYLRKVRLYETEDCFVVRKYK